MLVTGVSREDGRSSEDTERLGVTFPGPPYAALVS